MKLTQFLDYVKVSFIDLKIFDYFIYHGELYIKVDHFITDKFGNSYNSIKLTDDNVLVTNLTGDFMVKKVSLKKVEYCLK